MWRSIKKLIIDLREIIWPLLDPLEERTPRQISEIDCKWDDTETDIILQYVEKYHESEEKRRNQVESKSTIFIGTFAVAATILISLVKDMIFNNTVSCTPFRLFLISVLTLAIIYLCRAIWFSIKALERRRYCTTGLPDFMLSNCGEKKKKMIIRQYNNIKKNQDEINIKVDYMTMAHEYFKRAVATVALFTGIILLGYIVSYKVITTYILNIANTLNIDRVILITLCCISLILFVIVIALFRETMQIKDSIEKKRES
ncbi:hypothetical protein [Clostridium thailandense]|uniref:hypothetical protein n=1 Tax=Clostridium thailandense TaxID=2794346 RepID=UPI003989BDAE